MLETRAYTVQVKSTVPLSPPLGSTRFSRTQFKVTTHTEFPSIILLFEFQSHWLPGAVLKC